MKQKDIHKLIFIAFISLLMGTMLVNMFEFAHAFIITVAVAFIIGLVFWKF